MNNEPISGVKGENSTGCCYHDLTHSSDAGNDCYTSFY